MTERTNQERPRRPHVGTAGQQVLIGAVLAAVAWVVVLGWHAKKYQGADGYAAGPYSDAQVALLLGTLLAVAAVAEVQRARGTGPGVIIGLVVVFSADAATVNDSLSTGASLWPVGALMIAVGAWLALLALRALLRVATALWRRAVSHPASR